MRLHDEHVARFPRSSMALLQEDHVRWKFMVATPIIRAVISVVDRIVSCASSDSSASGWSNAVASLIWDQSSLCRHI